MRIESLLFASCLVAPVGCRDDGGRDAASAGTGTGTGESSSSGPEAASQTGESSTTQSSDSTSAGASSSPGGESSTGGSEIDLPDVELQWGACGPQTGASASAECATTSLPAYYGDPDFGSLNVHITRRLGSGIGQVWFFAGGPGESAATYSQLPLIDALNAVGLDAYFVNSRGIAPSTPMQCFLNDVPLSERLETCAQQIAETYNDGLSAFQSAESVRDMATLMLATDSAAPRFLWGISYGTYAGQRFLQQFPDFVNGAILEAFADRHWGGRSELSQEIGLEVLAACDADPECVARFPGTATQAYEQMVEELPSLPCGEPLGVDQALLRFSFFSIMEAKGARVLVPAIVHRIIRCEDQDIERLEALVTRGTFSGWDTPLEIGDLLESNQGFNGFYFTHYFARDMAADWPADAASLAEVWDTTWFDPFDGSRMFAEVDAVWPAISRQQDNAEFGVLPPTLVLSGAWDLRTAVSLAASFRERAEVQQVIFPQAGHFLTMDTEIPGELPCSTQVALGFLSEPNAQIDLSCIGELEAENFATGGDAVGFYANGLWGSTNVWDIEPGGKDAVPDQLVLPVEVTKLELLHRRPMLRGRLSTERN